MVHTFIINKSIFYQLPRIVSSFIYSNRLPSFICMPQCFQRFLIMSYKLSCYQDILIRFWQSIIKISFISCYPIFNKSSINWNFIFKFFGQSNSIRSIISSIIWNSFRKEFRIITKSQIFPPRGIRYRITKRRNYTIIRSRYAFTMLLIFNFSIYTISL